MCVERPKAPPTTTTNVIDPVIDSVDFCGAKEYMQTATFLRQTAICGAMKCGMSFWQKSKSDNGCCALQCAADEIKRGIPDCWDALKGQFKKQADNFGTVGKRRRATPVRVLNLDPLPAGFA